MHSCKLFPVQIQIYLVALFTVSLIITFCIILENAKGNENPAQDLEK